MKSNPTAEGRPTANGRSALSSASLRSCRRILAQIRRSKEAIFAEARGALMAREQLLRLALNEAEALVWQTLYPHLLFPSLAAEKVEGVAAWDSRQRALGRRARSLPFKK